MKRSILIAVLTLFTALALPAQWTVETWAGTGAAGHLDSTLLGSLFNKPWGLVRDTAGNLYLSDNSNFCIRKVDSGTGIVITLTGEPGVSGFVDGPAGTARLGEVTDMAIGPDGYLYVSDFTNHAIRKVDAAGNVTTVTGGTQGYVDGDLASAQFRFPRGLAIDRNGIVYVADSWNHRIRRIDVPGNSVSTFAGGGSSMGVGSTGAYLDGQDTMARFWTPCGLDMNAGDSLFVADAYNHRIRVIAADGRVTTLVGRGSSGAANGGLVNGLVMVARFNTPTEVRVLNEAGNYIVSDTYNHCLRWVDVPGDTVWTLAGTGTAGSTDGAATLAAFNQPRVVLQNSATEFLVADFNNNKVRILTNGHTAVQPPRNLQNENLVAGPSPLQSELKVSWLGSQPVWIRLTDCTGRQVASATRLFTRASSQWSVQTLPPGVYLLTAEDERGIVAVKKLVKE